MADENMIKLLEPGDKFGDYTVERLLGKGGMGAVYLIRAPDGEGYAAKVMYPDMVKKGTVYRRRLAREAEFAMHIHHKNLITVYDVGEDPDTGLCYIIMDYVPGGSVAERIEKYGPFPMAEAVSVVAQVALALEVAHRHGVVHRDIKPDNIMFDADGTPKLADLGVAKFNDDAGKTAVTTTGMIIGTLLFDRCRSLQCVTFEGNAPQVDTSDSLFGDVPENLRILVARGTKGWKGNGSSELPERWPAGTYEDSRPIHFLENAR